MNNSTYQDVDILVCCHKKDFFYEHKPFMPIHVGKALSKQELGIHGDNTGDNISHLNPNFCELTAHYWYWKNMATAKYVGLNHYRRYFGFGAHLPYGVPSLNAPVSAMDKLSELTHLPDLNKLFQSYDIILAKPNIYPYSLATDYSVCHSQSDLNQLRLIVDALHHEYIEAFDKILFANNKLSHYNMFIMRGDEFNRYSEWLFSILKEAYEQIPIPSDPVQARIYGYMAERLLNVYVHHHQMNIKYAPVIKVCDDPNIESAGQKVRAALRATRNNLAAWLTKPRLAPY